MSDMLRHDQKQCRKYRHDRFQVKLQILEIRQCEEGCLYNFREIKDTTRRSCHIAGNNRNQDRDHTEEPAKKDLSKHGNAKCHQKNDHVFRINHFIQQAGIACGISRKLQPDEGYNRSHGCCRQHDMNPFCAEFSNNQCNNDTAKSDGNKASQCILVTEFLNDQPRRNQKCKTGTQVRRCFSFCYNDEDQCADTVHQKHDRRTDSKQKRYQHRCSEHSKHMLKTQRDQHLYRYFLVHLNDFFLHFFFLLLFL